MWFSCAYYSIFTELPFDSFYYFLIAATSYLIVFTIKLYYDALDSVTRINNNIVKINTRNIHMQAMLFYTLCKRVGS